MHQLVISIAQKLHRIAFEKIEGKIESQVLFFKLKSKILHKITEMKIIDKI